MIPHTAPPFWPETRLGRFAAAIYKNSPDLLDDPKAAAAVRKCRVALLGLADDTGVIINHGRPGARRGPHALRAALARYGAAMPMPHSVLCPQSSVLSPPAAPLSPQSSFLSPHPPHPHSYPHVFDAGDIIASDDLHETHRRVTEAAGALVDLGFLPVGIGGGHDLTLAFVRALAARHKEGGKGGLAGVYIDAHLDVRPEDGSGMAFRRLIEDHGVGPLVNIGADPLSNADDHFQWFTANGGRIDPPDENGTLPALGPPPPTAMFVSIDLDAIDASQAPGVSATCPVGLPARIVAKYAYAAGRHPAVKCFDIMELNPQVDEGGRTARLAAHLLLQFLRGVAERDAAAGTEAAPNSRGGARP